MKSALARFKSPMSTLVLAGLMTVAAQAIADDATPPDSTQDQAANQDSMKNCMERQKATNSSLTQAAMETVCRNEAKKQKHQKDGNDLATGPQASKPQNQ